MLIPLTVHSSKFYFAFVHTFSNLQDERQEGGSNFGLKISEKKLERLSDGIFETKMLLQITLALSSKHSS